MQFQKINYIIGAFALTVLYLIYMKPGGFRLPRYYTPDGIIIPVGHGAGEMTASRFLEIGGIDPSAASAVFSESTPVVVLTDEGAGLMKTLPNSLLSVVNDFKYFIFFSYLFMLCGFWFINSGNDIHLALTSFIFGGFFLSSVLYLAYHELQFSWQILFFALPPSILNMGMRTTGKEINGYLIIAELILVTFLSLIAYVGLGSSATFYNLNLFASVLFFAAILYVILVQLDNSLRSTDDPVEKYKRWALFAGSIIGILIPALLLQFRWYWKFPGDPLAFLFAMVAVFPFTLLYGTYRLQLVPFQFVLTRSILAGLLTLFFVLIYGTVLLLHSLFLPEQEQRYQWIVSVVFLLILVFFLDPARRKFGYFLESRIFRLDSELSESLKRLSQLLSSPMLIQKVTAAFLNELRESTGIQRASLLFSNETFPALHLKHGTLLRISSRSKMWKYLKPDRIVVTNYLIYGAGDRSELYRFLSRNEMLLAIGISSPDSAKNRFEKTLDEYLSPGKSGQEVELPIQAALLIGEREDKRKYRLSHIRYFQEAARLAGLLMHNYALMIDEMEKRRRMRDLYLAGRLQKSLTDRMSSSQLPIRLAHLNMPAISVTGDYLDLIELPGRRVAFFLGDVSGHGLGTGYLVSTIRSIVHSHLSAGRGLIETVEILNHFLIDRYQGNEFLTMFSFILDTRNGEIEYVNAAHPGPYIKSPAGPLERLSDSQRLLGVLLRPYHSRRITIKAGQRIFLYSDGVTETFNPLEEPFGDARLEEFLRETGDSPMETIPQLLKKNLDTHRKSDGLTDDITFVAFEYSPRFQPLRNIFNIFGGRE